MNKKLTTQKRVKTAARNYCRNRAYKSSIKTMTKNSILVIEAMTSNSINNAILNIAKAFSRIDKSVKRKIVHKNKAARSKAILSKLFNKKYIEICSNK